MSTKEGFAQGGRDVEGGAAQRYDLTFLPAALEPMNMTFLGKGDESTDRIAIPEEAVAVVAEFVLLAFVIGFLDTGGEAFRDGFAGAAQDILAKFRFVDAADGILGQEGVVQVTEEFVIGGEGFLDRGEIVVIPFFFEGAAFVAGVEETFEGAIDGVVAEVDAEVIGGDGGDAVRFVEDDKIVGQEDAGLFAARWHAGVDEGEEEAVVKDHAVRLLDLLAGTLVETGGGVAVFTGTGGAVGIDGVPDIREGRGRKFLHDPVAAFGGPFGEADEVVFFVVWKEVGLSALGVLEGIFETGGATIVTAPDHEGGFERSVAFQFGDRIEEFATDFKILAADLFLQRDGMTGDNAGALGADGMDESGEEVGEAFANTGARLEKEGFAGFEGIGDRERHGALLGSMIELKDGLEVAAFFEDGFDERHKVTRHGGATAVFNESDHSTTKEH